MSYQEALARIASITGAQKAAQPAPANPAPTEGAFASELKSAQASAAGSSGIPVAAYRSPEPVQGGRLNQALFKPRMQAAEQIAERFGLKVTSSYRSPEHNASVGGVPNSLHTRGLGFDLVGSATQMEAARKWAASRPEIFQEVLVHDVGSGMHLHLGFKAS